MPICGHSAFVPTINEFLAHWGQVNVALGDPDLLVFWDGTSLADLAGYRDSLQSYSASQFLGRHAD